MHAILSAAPCCRRLSGGLRAAVLRLVLGALLVAGARAASPPPAANPGLVYTVTGGQTPVFLAGSLHLLASGGKKKWPAPLQAAYEKAGSVCLEVDRTERGSAARTQAALQTLGRLPAGTNLWRIVTPRTRAALDAAVTSRPLRDEAAACHPWRAAMLISQRQFGQSGIHLADGLETQLTRQAVEDGKLLLGLSPALAHYQRLSRLSRPAQEYFLCSSIAPSGDMAADLRRMEQAWRNGDLAFLNPRAASAYNGNAEVRAALLTTRNREWLPSIAKFTVAPQPVLVVVGCLHLCGPGSLPELLRARGYTVTPFPAPAATSARR